MALTLCVFDLMTPLNYEGRFRIWLTPNYGDEKTGYWGQIYLRTQIPRTFASGVRCGTYTCEIDIDGSCILKLVAGEASVSSTYFQLDLPGGWPPTGRCGGDGCFCAGERQGKYSVFHPMTWILRDVHIDSRWSAFFSGSFPCATDWLYDGSSGWDFGKAVTGSPSKLGKASVGAGAGGGKGSFFVAQIVRKKTMDNGEIIPEVVQRYELPYIMAELSVGLGFDVPKIPDSIRLLNKTGELLLNKGGKLYNKAAELYNKAGISRTASGASDPGGGSTVQGSKNNLSIDDFNGNFVVASFGGGVIKGGSSAVVFFGANGPEWGAWDLFRFSCSGWGWSANNGLQLGAGVTVGLGRIGEWSIGPVKGSGEASDGSPLGTLTWPDKNPTSL